MRKEIINRIKWEESDRIQIFCNRQYKGYYVRGNIDSVWDSFSFYDEKSKNKTKIVFVCKNCLSKEKSNNK